MHGVSLDKKKLTGVNGELMAWNDEMGTENRKKRVNGHLELEQRFQAQTGHVG